MGVRNRDYAEVETPKTSSELLQAVDKRRRKRISEVVAPRRKISTLVDRVTTNLSPGYGKEVAEYKRKIDALFQQRNGHGHAGSGQLIEVVDALKSTVQQNNTVMADLASAVHQLSDYLQRCDGTSQSSTGASTTNKSRMKKS